MAKQIIDRACAQQGEIGRIQEVYKGPDSTLDDLKLGDALEKLESLSKLHAAILEGREIIADRLVNTDVNFKTFLESNGLKGLLSHLLDLRSPLHHYSYKKDESDEEYVSSAFDSSNHIIGGKRFECISVALGAIEVGKDYMPVPGKLYLKHLRKIASLVKSNSGKALALELKSLWSELDARELSHTSSLFDAADSKISQAVSRIDSEADATKEGLSAIRERLSI